MSQTEPDFPDMETFLDEIEEGDRVAVTYWSRIGTPGEVQRTGTVRMRTHKLILRSDNAQDCEIYKPSSKSRPAGAVVQDPPGKRLGVFESATRVRD